MDAALTPACRICRKRPEGDAAHMWLCAECYAETMDDEFMDQLPDVQDWEAENGF